MESFGEILKTTREAAAIDIEKVSHDTSISIEYIRALEMEQTDIFPGEPYLIGFLRNYAEYLALDSSYLIRLYRSKKIQEAPIPEGLLRDEKSFPWKIFIPILSVLLIGLGIGSYFLFSYLNNKTDTNILQNAYEPQVFTLSSVPIQKRVYENDIISLILPSGQVEILVDRTKEYLVLSTPNGKQQVQLGEEMKLDVDSILGPDIVVFLSDIAKNDASRGAELRMFALSETTENEAVVAVDGIPLITEADKNLSQTIIFDGTRAYPFTLNITFRGPCLFRTQADNKDIIEDYFTSGDLQTITANNGIRVWMSNANALKMQVIGDGKTFDLDVGRPGQVLVQDIKWVKDVDGRFKLMVLLVD